MIPNVEPGASGSKEVNIFQSNCPIPLGAVEKLTHVLLMVCAVLLLFGTKIPHVASDIPQNILAGLGIIAIVITIISGMLASYIGGSKSYKRGIINGGLVGFILSVFMGAVSGASAFLLGFSVFGFLSILGGILGTLLKKYNH